MTVTEHAALPTAVDLADILSETCESLLGSTPDAPLTDSAQLHAAVTISGEWEGAVEVNCPGELARWIATQLLNIEGHNVYEDDVADTLGELANIVGGTVKAMLPQPSALSLPCVTGDTEPHRPDQADSVSASIDIGGQLLTAVVWTPTSTLTDTTINETRTSSCES